MSKISRILAKKILNSNGEETVEIFGELANGVSATASVPEGKSKGSREVGYVKADVAVSNISGTIAKALTGKNPKDQKEIDETLISLDGSENRDRLGGNAILAASMLSARLSAASGGVSLWSYIRSLGGFYENKPRVFMTFVEGGAHAGNNLPFQEYLVLLKKDSFDIQIKKGLSMYNALEERLYTSKNKNPCIGDLGGFATDFNDDVEPFELLREVVSGDGYDIGIDAAAEEIKDSPASLFNKYRTLKSEFKNFVYIEDPFKETDIAPYGEITREMGEATLISGDDLTCSRSDTIGSVSNNKMINAVVIAPNHTGTLMETFDAVRVASENGIKVIITARAKETNDSFIADLAFGVGAYGFKPGAPRRGERVAKYNRLLEIETEDI